MDYQKANTQKCDVQKWFEKKISIFFAHRNTMNYDLKERYFSKEKIIKLMKSRYNYKWDMTW